MKIPSAKNSTNYLKIGQAAKILGVSIDTLRRWGKTGKIKTIRTPGGTRLYSNESLQSIGLGPPAPPPKIPKPPSTESLLKKLGEKESFLFKQDDFSDIQESSTPPELQEHSTSLLQPRLYRGQPTEEIETTPEKSFRPSLKLIMGGFLFFLFTLIIMGAGLYANETFNFFNSSKQPELISKTLANPNVLAVSAGNNFLEINSDAQINGNLNVRDCINDIDLKATPSATIKPGCIGLTVTQPSLLDQDVDTTASPSFASINLSGTNNQIVFQSGGPTGTLTWTPTDTRIITLPDVTTTLVGTDTTQTLTNKSISGSSNTLTNIPNSALTNSSITIDAGTNLSGGGSVSLGGSTTLNLEDSISLSGTLTVAGTTTLNGVTYTWPSADGSSSQSLTTNGAGTLTWSSATSTTGWTDDGTTVRLTTSSDNVGIGTSSPNFKLDVAGNVGISGSLTSSNAVRIAAYDCSTQSNGGKLTTDSSGNLVCSADSAGSLTGGATNAVAFWDSSTTISNSVANFYWDSSSNRLGIGTSAPTYNLQNTGTTFLNGFVGIGSSLSVTGNVGIGQSLSVSSAAVLDSLSVTKSISGATLGISGTSFLAGNTGIGNSLTVGSLTTLNSSLTLNSLGSSAGTSLCVNSGNQVVTCSGSSALTGTGVANMAAIWSSTSNLTTGLIFDNGANVGIGNTNPSSTLSVSGNVGIGWTGAPTASMPGLGLSVFGNVGIGTTSPAGNLQVNGSLLNINASTNDSIFNLTSTGDLLIQDNGTSIATFTDTGAITFAPTGSSDLAITLDDDTTANFTQTLTADTTENAILLSLNAGGTGATGTMKGLYVVQNDTGTTGGYDALIHVENLKTPETLADGILIEQDATSGTMTNGLRVLANGGTLTNGIQVQRASGTLTNGMIFSGNMNDTIEITSQPVVGTSGNIINIASTLAVMTGSNTVRGIFLDFTNADHITGSNVLTAIDIDSITGDAETTETALRIGTGWETAIGILGGNVGIGTTAPTYNLENTGTTFLNGFVGIGSSLSVTGNVGIGQSLSVSSAAVLDSLSVTKSISGATLGISGTSFLAGNTGIGNSLTVGSLTTLNSSLTLNSLGSSAGTSLCVNSGNQVVTCSGSSALTGTGVANMAAIWSSSTNLGVGLIYDNGASVGVGTSSPLARFDVRGAGNSTNLALLTRGVGTTNPFGLAVLDNGNVGVGTTNPGYKFAVEGSAAGTSGVIADVKNNNATGFAQFGTQNSAGEYMRLFSYGGSYTLSQFQSNGALAATNSMYFIPSGDTQSGGGGTLNFMTGGWDPTSQIRMHIDSGGNVGINTLTPGSKFQVNGNAAIGYGSAVVAPTNGLAVSGNVGIGTSSPNYNLQNAGTTYLSGFVGIGSSLSVTGNVGVGGSLTTNNAVRLANFNCSTQSNGGKLTTDSSGNLVCSADSAGSLTGGATNAVAFWDSSTTISNSVANFYWDSSSNRLGIGTSAPTYNLQNTGTTFLNGFVGIGSSLSVTGNVGIGQSLSVSSAAVLDSLSVTKSISGATLGISGTSALTGNVGIGGSLTVNSTGAFRLSGQNCSSLSNGGKLTTDASGNVYCSADTAGSITGGITNMAAIWSSATTLSTGLLFDNGANVGVGTSSPLARFDVRGAGNSTNLALLTRGTGSDNQFGLAVLDNGNVGIGTTSPGNRFEVLNLIEFNDTDKNTFLGFQTGLQNIDASGLNNSFVGYQAGLSNTSGDNNSAVGYQALLTNTTGSFNSALGASALAVNSTGSFNSAFGYAALTTNNEGSNNSAFGYAALNGNSTGSANSAFGHTALVSVGIGTSNAAFGYAAGDSITGESNTIIGTRAGDSLTTGSGNIVLGYFADALGATVSNSLNIGNVIFGTGMGSGTSVATGNIGIGNTIPSQKLQVNSNGSSAFVVTSGGNVGIGFTSPSSNLYVNSTTTTTTGINFVNNTSLTTGNLLSLGVGSSMTTGNMVNISNTSPLLTTGSLLSMDWTPISTVTGSTGDLLKLTIGSNGANNALNFLNFYSGSTSVFSVSQQQFTTSLPANFTSPGDLSVAYDLVFTNPTASYIKSSAPLVIEAGETFESSDLTFRTYNHGEVLVDSKSLRVINGGNVGIGVSFASSTLPSNGLAVQGNVGIGTTTANSKLSVAGNAHIGTIRQGIAAPTDGLLVDGNVGIGATTSTNKLDVWGNTRLAGNLNLDGSGLIGFGGASVTAPTSGLAVKGNVGIGTTTAAAALDVIGAIALNHSIVLQQNVPLNNLFVGFNAGNVSATGGFNTFVGIAAGTTNTSGTDNSAFGYQAFDSNSSGARNSAFGSGALTANSSGTDNSAFGYQALDSNTSGGSNSAFGSGTLGGNTTGIQNSAFGYQALDSNTTGDQNSAFGYAALGGNTTGIQNSAFGYQALASTTAASANSAFGRDALTSVGVGTSNAGFGYLAGFQITGSTNTIIGTLAGQSLTTGSGNIVLGYNANALGATVSNSLNIGNVIFGTGMGSGTTMSAGGNIGIGNSLPQAKLIVNGNVGIGVTTATRELEVGGDIRLGLTQTATANGLCHSGANSAAALGANDRRDIVICSGSPTDLAEWFEVGDNSEAADIMVVTDEMFTYEAKQLDPYTGMELPGTVTTSIPKLVKSSTTYDRKILGVISTSPNRIMGTDVREQGQNPKPIALTGRVPVKISTENGAVAVGDFLTSSSTPGVAMKATQAGFSIGQALEAYSGSDVGKILVFVNPVFYQPADSLSLASQINTLGNIGIGVTNPTAKLDIYLPTSDPQVDLFKLNSDVGGVMTTVFRVDAGGNIFATGSISTGENADLAENYPTEDQSIEEGDLVSAANTGIAKSSGSYDSKMLGIISTKPGITLSGATNGKPVALGGRVPVKVSLENGPIAVGDYLTSSSIPGVAMKATRPGPTIGKALEELTTSNLQPPTKIMAFVNVSYADPGNFLASLALDDQGNLIVPKLKTGSIVLDPALVTVNPDINTSLSSQLVNTNTFDELSIKIASLESRIGELEKQVAGESTSSAELVAPEPATPSATVAETTTATPSATIQLPDFEPEASTSSDIATESAILSNEEIELALTDPTILFATESAILNSLEVQSEATVSGMLTSYQAEIQDNFKVFGLTTLANTNVAGDLNIDGTLSIENGSEINVIGTLFLQKSPLADGLDILNGKVTINSDGTLKAQTVLTSEYQVIAGKTSGSGKILAGQLESAIFADKVTNGSRIFIQPTSPTSQQIYVSEKVPGAGFVVAITTGVPRDITFDYWIINEITEAN